jgi:hypothetical protein
MEEQVQWTTCSACKSENAYVTWKLCKGCSARIRNNVDLPNCLWINSY